MSEPGLPHIPIKEPTPKTDWQSLMVGVFIGYLLTLGWSWYTDKDKLPYDWCFHLSEGKAEYCTGLYNESVDNQRRFYEEHGDPNEGIDPYPAR